MNNLYNMAKSGLSTAGYALNVVGNNLVNGMSNGYSRRDVIIGESGGLSTARGFFGSGANVVGVHRAYDAFANNQLRGSISQYNSYSGRYEQLADIDNMLGDEADNVSVSLGNLFKAFTLLNDEPDSGSNRSAVFTALGTLTQRFKDSGKRLSGLETSTNTQIEQSAKSINSATEQLAELNAQLERLQGQTGSAPADLLDKRDVLLEELSEQLGINVTENQVTGRVDVTLPDGRPLVSGNTAYKLETSPSASDPKKTIVSYVDSDGKATPLKEDSVTKGRLGGLFKFRNEDLEMAKNELNQIAFQMASRMNEQHEAGFDQNDDQGKALFKLPTMKGIANSGNTGTGSLDKITVTDSKQVSAENYSITFDGGAWKVTGEGGRAVTVDTSDPTKLKFDGLELEIPAGANAGDSFTLNPLAGMAEGIERNITSAAEIAASDVMGGGVSNNNNLQKLLDIQDEKLIGKSTLSEAYSTLVGNIGSRAREVKSGIGTAEIDLQSKFDTKQQLTGVDMNEESVNLTMFQQYYAANVQVLQAANTMFDTLLTLK
ncbi:flagellar hook-associated protein FlgK [Enterobacteriaceae bacterium C23F]